MFLDQIEPSWAAILADECQKPYFQSLMSFVEGERSSGQSIFPAKSDVFSAFNATPFHQVKVVIVGQDPYHGAGQAHGLCFSVQEGIKFPPSLKNIFKELQADVGISPPAHGNLVNWAKQGVLMLNTTLTVREGKPLSHQGQGWEIFTDAVISKLGERNDPLIFILWGKFAQEKCKHLSNPQHHILTAPHPSPFSAHSGFFGCRHFSAANAILGGLGKPLIDWSL